MSGGRARCPGVQSAGSDRPARHHAPPGAVPFTGRRARSDHTPMDTLVTVLPGELRVDAGLVDSAVLDLNLLRQHGALQTALAIGDYVIRRFFEGSIELFHAREAGHCSYRALAQDEDLDVSAAELWTAVNLVQQRELLGAKLTEALSLSHHRVLIGVRDVERKRALAELAVTDGLGRDALERVAHEGRHGRTGGRPRLPQWFKDARRTAKALRRMQPVGAGGLDGPGVDGEAAGAEGGVVAEAKLEELREMVREADVAWQELKRSLGVDDATD